MRVIFKIFFVLIVNVLLTSDLDAHAFSSKSCHDDEQLIVDDKALQEYEDYVMKSVFEKPYFNRTSSLSVPSSCFRTLSFSKKTHNNSHNVSIIRHLSEGSSHNCFVMSSHVLSDSDKNIYYVILRHIII